MNKLAQTRNEKMLEVLKGDFDKLGKPIPKRSSTRQEVNANKQTTQDATKLRRSRSDKKRSADNEKD